MAQTESGLSLPTIHSNGTSADDLHAGYLEAWQAIGAAVTALGKTGPHGRDYYPQGQEAFVKAQKEHLSRCSRLRDVFTEIESIVMELSTQSRAEGSR